MEREGRGKEGRWRDRSRRPMTEGKGEEGKE